MKTYLEIREEALSNGIKDNRVSVGAWASFMGYRKIRIQKDKKVTIYYYKEL